MAELGKTGLLMMIKRVLRQMGVSPEQIEEDLAEYSTLSVDELEATIARLGGFLRPVLPGEGSSRDPTPRRQSVERAYRTPIQGTQEGSGTITQEGAAERRRRSRYSALCCMF